MNDATSIDPHAVLITLGVSGATSVTPVSGGRDTALWRVEHEGRSYALRVFQPEQLRMSQREVQAMQLAAAHGMPVPRVRISGVWNERPALLLSWCAGTTVLEALQSRPPQAEPLGQACGGMLASIHALTVPDEESDRAWLDWGGLSDEPLRHRLESIARHDRLLHLDYHPLNIMIEDDTITGVLDWANAHAGDPRADLARSRTILLLDAVEHMPEARPIIEAFDRGLVAGYEAVAGPQPDMPLFYAWAGRVMLHDLRERLHEIPGQMERIEMWVERWLSGTEE